MHADRKIPEGVVPLRQLQKFDSGDFLPGLGQVGRFEFGHKIGKGQFEKAIAVDAHPVLNSVVMEPCKDLSHLFLVINVFGIKIAMAGEFVSAHHVWRDVAGQENGNFGWGVLLYTSKFRLRQHGSFTLGNLFRRRRRGR